MSGENREMAEHTEVPTTHYGVNGQFGCTEQIGPDDEDICCSNDAPWVPTEFVNLNGDSMMSGWLGEAWCDEHRPQASTTPE